MNLFDLFFYTAKDLGRMPPRTQESHKGTYGRVVLICGSEGMAGAAYLCGKAAYRTGAGLVEIVTPEANRTILQTLLPEAVLTIYDESPEGLRAVRRAIGRADALGVGCGLGLSDRSLTVLTLALTLSHVPTVLDADALNLLSKHDDLLPLLAGKIITPHPTEMSRLSGLSVGDILADTATVARDFASRHNCVCVLKTHKTVVSDGSNRIYQNNSGNSGMATAGSGDVLCGILCGILAQKKVDPTPLETASLSVYLHGLCGDEAAKSLGEYSVMASDLIEALPCVLRQIV